MPVLVFLLSSFAVAQNPSFTLEQVMSSPFPTGLTAASTGERIAWTSAFRGVRNVWVADGPSFAAKQVTHYTDDDGMQIASVRLTPDGKTVLYARGSEQNREGEVADSTSNINQPHQQVFAVDIDRGGQPRLLGEMGCTSEECEDIQISPDGQLAVWAARKQIWIAPIAGGTQAKSIGYIRGDNRQPKWSPDGKQIAFESDRGDHSFIGIYDRSRDTIRWIAPTFDRDAMPRWSADGASIAYIHVAGREMKQPLIPIEPEPWSLRIANANTGEAREVWHSSNDTNASLPRTEEESFYFARDRLVFGYEQDGWNHLYSVSIQGGQAVLLTPGEFDVEEVSLTPDRQTVIYTSNQNDVDRRHIWSVPAAGGTPKALSSGETIEWTPVVTGDGKVVTCLGSSATTPAMPYHLTGNRREMIAGDTLPKDFPSAQLVVPKQVIFTAEDGWKIHGQLFVPKNVKGRAPGLLFMHGGSKRQMMLGFHNMYYYHNAYAENQYLASRGFVVLSVNYRTGIMYGRNFREPEDGGWRGASEYKDIVAAGKYLQSQPNVDPQRIGLWGGSYGGFLTAMGLARNSDIFKAGVDMHGVHDWSARALRFGGGGSGANEGDQPPDVQQARQLAFRSSPNSAIATWSSPVLLIQGDDDRNVSFSQSVDLAQRLKAQRVPFEQIVFPDEIHDFLLWRSWVRAYDAGENFFERLLVKGEKLPPPQ